MLSVLSALQHLDAVPLPTARAVNKLFLMGLLGQQLGAIVPNPYSVLWEGPSLVTDSNQLSEEGAASRVHSALPRPDMSTGVCCLIRHPPSAPHLTLVLLNPPSNVTQIIRLDGQTPVHILRRKNWKVVCIPTAPVAPGTSPSTWKLMFWPRHIHSPTGDLLQSSTRVPDTVSGQHVTFQDIIDSSETLVKGISLLHQHDSWWFKPFHHFPLQSSVQTQMVRARQGGVDLTQAAHLLIAFRSESPNRPDAISVASLNLRGFTLSTFRFYVSATTEVTNEPLDISTTISNVGYPDLSLVHFLDVKAQVQHTILIRRSYCSISDFHRWFVQIAHCDPRRLPTEMDVWRILRGAAMSAVLPFLNSTTPPASATLQATLVDLRAAASHVFKPSVGTAGTTGLITTIASGSTSTVAAVSTSMTGTGTGTGTGTTSVPTVTPPTSSAQPLASLSVDVQVGRISPVTTDHAHRGRSKIREPMGSPPPRATTPNSASQSPRHRNRSLSPGPMRDDVYHFVKQANLDQLRVRVTELSHKNRILETQLAEERARRLHTESTDKH